MAQDQYVLRSPIHTAKCSRSWMIRLTADVSPGATNTTNLAIKGIVGVKAMSEISRALGNDIDTAKYDVSAPFPMRRLACSRKVPAESELDPPR